MWIITTWLRISQEVTVKCFKRCCMSNAMDETDMLWNGSKEDVNVRSIRKMKALTVKMETVTMSGKGR
jgi:DNA polymerase/3'-5' exonuclease PolX